MTVSGVLPVVPTPFQGGRFDRDSFERMLDHSLNWLDGYTLLGSTGEAPSLSTSQRMAIVEQAIDSTPGDKDVVVGVSHTCLEESILLARHAQDTGARAVLCSVPYYFANSADGVLAYLRELDAALEIDLVLYDNPVATKTALPPNWVLHWAEQLEHLRSVKLTDHNLAKIAAWRNAGLSVLAGDDPIIFQFLAAGVDGVMVICPAVLPRSFFATWTLAAKGDADGALTIFSREIAPFVHAFGIGDEVATTKALFADLEIFASDELLPPLVGVSAKRRRHLLQAYELGLAAASERAEVS